MTVMQTTKSKRVWRSICCHLIAFLLVTQGYASAGPTAHTPQQEDVFPAEQVTVIDEATATVQDIASVTNFTELEDALTAANEGDCITIENDITFLYPLVIDKSLIIQASGEDVTLLAPISDMDGLGRHFQIAPYIDITIEFRGVTLSGQNVSSGGYQSGGIHILNQASVTCTGLILKNCTSRSGGAMHIENDSTLELLYSEIYDSYADKNGGGIYAQCNAALILDETTIQNCHAESDGGGIAVDSNTTIKLENTVIQNCLANENGGGIALNGVNDMIPYTAATRATPLTQLTMLSGSIEGNQALIAGGGVSLQAARALIQGGTITENSAPAGGGIAGIEHPYDYRENGYFIIIGQGEVINNHAENGGGIYADSWYHVYLQNGGAISNNEATTGSGGGIHIAGEHSTFYLNSGKLSNNTAFLHGGGIYAKTIITTLVFNHGFITGNHAMTGNGGGIGYESEDEAAGSMFTHIRANYADAVFADNMASMAYEIDPADIPLHQNNILTTHFTTPFDYAYNNYDIGYVSATPLSFCTVTYDSLGGTPVPSTTVLSGKRIIEPSPPIKSGYTFNGWYTDTQQPWNFSIDVVMQDITLYAKWTNDSGAAQTYTLTFESNGGTSIAPIQVPANQAVALATYLPTRSNYTFDGWYLESALQNKVTSVTMDSHKTIYAKWVQNSSGGGGTTKKYTLTFECNGGSKIAPIQVAANKTVALSAYLPTRENFIFDGWYLETELQSKVTSVTMNKNKTVYAKWKKETEEPDNNGIDGLITQDHFAYIKGFDDKTVRPDAFMTRAEAAQMFYNLLSSKAMGTKESAFSDVAAHAWYHEAITVLASRGILLGYKDQTFQPQGAITRAEFSALVSRFGNLVESKADFTDVATSHWAYQYIANASKRGWIDGYADGSFRPDQNISRAEVVHLTNYVLGRSADKTFIETNASRLSIFPDLGEKHWAYPDFMEAAHAHEYEIKDGKEVWTKLSSVSDHT